jgi:hypothetical protein
LRLPGSRKEKFLQSSKMGANQSNVEKYDEIKEKPDQNKEATLYYFAGRGLADQIRFVFYGGSPRHSG